MLFRRDFSRKPPKKSPVTKLMGHFQLSQQRSWSKRTLTAYRKSEDSWLTPGYARQRGENAVHVLIYPVFRKSACSINSLISSTSHWLAQLSQQLRSHGSQSYCSRGRHCRAVRSYSAAASRARSRGMSNVLSHYQTTLYSSRPWSSSCLEGSSVLLCSTPGLPLTEPQTPTPPFQNTALVQIC